MRIGRVIGNLVSTIKDRTHHGLKLMIVELLDLDGKPCESEVVCIDTADAGIGDTVIVSNDGDSALMIFEVTDCAVDWVICGVVDYYTTQGQTYKV